MGAPLYALLLCEDLPEYSDDDVIAVLGRHGADKVLLVQGKGLTEPATYATHGEAIHTALDRLPPALTLFAATASGRDIAPRVATRLGAVFVGEGSVEYGSQGDLVLSRSTYQRTHRRRISAEDLQRPVVATLSPGSYRLAEGNGDVEVIAFSPPEQERPRVEVVSRTEDPASALEAARIVVTAGAGLGPDEMQIVDRLASALGAEVAVTRSAFDKGLGSRDRVVGTGGKKVSPVLYVAVGCAGSAEHLGGVADDAEIVAINPDASAPIFTHAEYGLVGKLGDLGDELVQLAARKAHVA